MNTENSSGLTPLEQIGEFGLIDRITAKIQHINATTIKGIGDDCAVIETNGKKLVIGSDSLSEGIHFDLSYVPLKHLGYKAVAVNLSDLCAMNVLPTHLILNIAISSKFTAEAMDEFYEGVHAACKRYGVDLVGGDTSSSVKGFFISGTAFGFADESKIVYRSGAQEKELICVSGDLGSAYAGLQLLEREKRIFTENPNFQPDLSGNDYILERQLKPEPRTDVIKMLDEAGVIPTSMIDVSDGLASEINHICKASDKGCVIYLDRIPTDPSASTFLESMKIHPAVAALNGGEDYELLFTIKQEDYEKIAKNPEFTVIGYMTDKNAGRLIETPDGSHSDIDSGGWNAFAKL